jgi:hypothetical protein
MMTKRVSVAAGLILAGLLALGWHYYGGTTVPPGQPPLASLTTENFGELRTAFNAGVGNVRVVLLLSPT